MEDHHHHHQYSNYMVDPRLYVNRPLYAPVSPPSDLSPYSNMLVFRSADDSCNNNNNNMMSVANTTSAGGASSSVVGGGGEGFSGGFEMEVGGGGGRWPRQETLTLLEIRSRLDAKFKEANQKGPLWEEVSRIMSEEHGYQRSGKKCREKFENLYKYYKKTKEGKAGRQDGKHYRFFRQLEALYGDSNTISEANLIGGNHFHYNSPNMNMMITSLANNDQELNPISSKMSDTSLSLSKFSDSHTTSSDESDHNEGLMIKKRGKRSLKVKIKDFIEQQMKKLTDKQEEWMEKMMRTIEHKEQERMLREEEWRRQDAERIEMEHKFWASERAWIESRDASLMDTFQKLSGKVLTRSSSRHPDHQELMARSISENGSDQTMNNNSPAKGEIWPECEILKLIQLKTEMDLKVQQCEISSMSEEMFWDGISRKMACFFGHDRSGLMCKEKWESVNNYAFKCHNKKRKENHESICSQRGGAYSHEQGVDHTIRLNIDNHGNSNAGNNNGLSESCFRYFMGDDYGRIMD